MKGGTGNGLEIMLDIQQDEYLPVWGETGMSPILGGAPSLWLQASASGRGSEAGRGLSSLPPSISLQPLLHTPWARQEARHVRGRTQRVGNARLRFPESREQTFPSLHRFVFKSALSGSQLEFTSLFWEYT